MTHLKPGQSVHQPQRPRPNFIYLAVGAMALLVAARTTALAQSSGGVFEIHRVTVDNGGGRSSGGQFTLAGSIGQPDASTQTASGGRFQLRGGFWAKGDSTPPHELVFADGFEGS